MNEQDNKNKKQYQFDGRYKDQLESSLQGSIAFRFYSEKIQGREEERLVIRFDKNLLPQHRKLELIENAFASLEKHPENIQLLKALGEYTKNTRYEQIWYSGLGGGMGLVEFNLRSAVYAVSAFFLAMITFTVFPLVAFTVASIAVAALTLSSLNVSLNGEPALKFGRWIRSLVKGANQEPANLRELEDNLSAGINACKASSEQIHSSKVAPQESAAEQTSAQASSKVRAGFSYADADAASASTFYKPVEAATTPDDSSVRTGYTLSQV